MSLALKPLKPKDDTNLFASVVYHISFCTFLTLLVIRNAAIAINILIYLLGNTLSSFTKQLIMIAAERSASIAKSCLVLVEFLAVSYIKYIDFDDNSKQKVQKVQKVSSEQNSIKSILSNASKRVQVQSKISPINASRTPVVSPEILKKSEAARSRSIPTIPSINKPTEASTALSSFYSELSLKNAEKERLPLEQRYRSSVPSSLGKNRSNGREVVSGGCLSKRYSTLASEKPKRTITMKLINSTAANRASKRSKKYQDNDDDDEEDEEEEKLTKQQKSSTRQKPEIKDKNLNLSDERPTITQPPRTLNLNKSSEIHLQASRRYLKVKVMMKVRKHRNTI